MMQKGPWEFKSRDLENKIHLEAAETDHAIVNKHSFNV